MGVAAWVSGEREKRERDPPGDVTALVSEERRRRRGCALLGLRERGSRWWEFEILILHKMLSSKQQPRHPPLFFS